MKVCPRKMPNIPSAVIGLGSAMMIMPGLSTLSISSASVRSAKTCGLSVTISMPCTCVGRVAGFDLGDDLAVAGQRDLVPELAHHLGRRSQRDRRADLRGEAVVPGGELHIDDVALFELAVRRARIAEHHRRVGHRR